MGYSGARPGGHWFMKKIWCHKSRVRLPLMPRKPALKYTLLKEYESEEALYKVKMCFHCHAKELNFQWDNFVILFFNSSLFCPDYMINSCKYTTV
jgi:hypothetical protein